MTKFENIKNKTIDICSKSIIDLTEFFKKFNLKDISNVCLDSVFFIFYLEKLGIKDSSYLIMKAHKVNLRNKKEDKLLHLHLNSKILMNFFIKDNNLYLVSIFAFTLCCLILLKSFRSSIKNNLINFLNRFENFLNHENQNNDAYYKRLLEYYKVKNFLLYDENALLKDKYGKEFEPDLLSEETILDDLKYYIQHSEELNKVILESKMALAELKFNIIETLTNIFLYFIIALTYGYFSIKFYHTFGLFSLLLFNFLFFIVLISAYVIKKSISIYKKKKELGKIF